MADDWMTDAHKAAALEGFLSNPVAVAYAWQAAGPGGRTLAGYSGDEQTRIWFGEANGCTVQHVARAPEAGGPAEVFVRGILTTTVDGVELVDADGNQLAHAVQAVGLPVVKPEETALDLVSWLREQIAVLRQAAWSALRGSPFEDLDGSERDGDFWHSHWDALYQGPRPDHPVGGKEIADFPQAPHAAAFAARFDPQAALAQCESHNAILAVHNVRDVVYPTKDRRWRRPNDRHCVGCGLDPEQEYVTADVNDCPTLRATALAYQHRPGFREEWRRG